MMRVSYAYEYKGKTVHTNSEVTGHQSARAFAEALADVPKRMPVDTVVVWDPIGVEVRVPQRAASGIG